MERLIVGCGYLGYRVSQRWVAAGDTVFALTRSPERGSWLKQQGLTPLVGDVTQPASLPALPSVDSVLIAVGFDRSSGKTIRQVYVEGLSHILDRLPATIRRIVYTSSTGVYGQTDGSQVDEHSPCQPRREGGKACLAAEQLLSQGPHGNRSVILRLAGIYGPDRLPRWRRLQAGEPLATSGQGLLNLIHVDDAAEACRLACEAALELPQVILTSDGHPVVRQSFYEELARLTAAPRPVFSGIFASPAAAARAASSKRIGNRRLIEQLGIELRYPDYRRGLAAIVQAWKAVQASEP